MTILPIDGHRIAMTNRESELFAVLFNARGAVLSEDELQRKVWGLLSTTRSNLYVYMRRLREKLRQTRFEIRKFHGRGYRMVRA